MEKDIYTCSRCGKHCQKTYVMPKIELQDNEILAYSGDTRLCRACAEIVIHEYNAVRDMTTYETDDETVLDRDITSAKMYTTGYDHRRAYTILFQGDSKYE